MISLRLLNLTADLHLFSLDFSITSLDFPGLSLYLVNIHLRSILCNVLLTQLLLQIRNGITHNITPAPVVIDGLLHIVHIFSERFYTGFQLFDLTPAAQKITVILKGTTRHGTTWAEGFSLHRYHAEAVPVLSGNGNGIVNVVHHKHASQKIGGKSCIFRTCGHQLTGKPDHARLF